MLLSVSMKNANVSNHDAFEFMYPQEQVRFSNLCPTYYADIPQVFELQFHFSSSFFANAIYRKSIRYAPLI